MRATISIWSLLIGAQALAELAPGRCRSGNTNPLPPTSPHCGAAHTPPPGTHNPRSGSAPALKAGCTTWSKSFKLHPKARGIWLQEGL